MPFSVPTMPRILAASPDLPEIPTCSRNCTGERKTSKFIARVLYSAANFARLAEMSSRFVQSRIFAPRG